MKTDKEIAAEVVKLLPLYLSPSDAGTIKTARRAPRYLWGLVVLIPVVCLAFPALSPPRPVDVPNMQPLGLAVILACWLGGARGGWIATAACSVVLAWLIPPVGLWMHGPDMPWFFAMVLSWSAIVCVARARGCASFYGSPPGGSRVFKRMINFSKIVKVYSSSVIEKPSRSRLSSV
jgi:hypothetical protein